MVTRRSTVKRTGTRRRAAAPKVRPAPVVPAVRPQAMARMKTRLETAGRTLQATGRVAGRFASRSLREVSGAVQASREPMTALLRNVRLAGRHVMRDAVAAWQEVVPAQKLGPKGTPRVRRVA